MIDSDLRRTVETLRRAVDRCGLELDDLSAVLLIGGSSRIPAVAQLISMELELPVAIDADPKASISLGAAGPLSRRLAPCRRPIAVADDPGRLARYRRSLAGAPVGARRSEARRMSDRPSRHRARGCRRRHSRVLIPITPLAIGTQEKLRGRRYRADRREPDGAPAGRYVDRRRAALGARRPGVPEGSRLRSTPNEAAPSTIFVSSAVACERRKRRYVQRAVERIQRARGAETDPSPASPHLTRRRIPPRAGSGPEPDPTTDPAPVPEPEPTTDPAPEPTTDPAPDPVPDPTTDPAPEPTTEPAPEPDPDARGPDRAAASAMSRPTSSMERLHQGTVGWEDAAALVRQMLDGRRRSTSASPGPGAPGKSTLLDELALVLRAEGYEVARGLREYARAESRRRARGSAHRRRGASRRRRGREDHRTDARWRPAHRRGVPAVAPFAGGRRPRGPNRQAASAHRAAAPVCDRRSCPSRGAARRTAARKSSAAASSS